MPRFLNKNIDYKKLGSYNPEELAALSAWEDIGKNASGCTAIFL